MILFIFQVTDILKGNINKVLERDTALEDLDTRAGKCRPKKQNSKKTSENCYIFF